VTASGGREEPSGGEAREPESVRTVTVVGTGLIGGGWVAHFLRRGYDVIAHDTEPGAQDRLNAMVDRAWPTLERLGLADGARRDRLGFSGSLTEAVSAADFVQESVPERLDVKIRVLADIDAAAPEGVVVASSTSGYTMTDMQSACRTPGRFVVGHPFNPPYLIPLVEVVGGRATDPATVTWADRFYRHAGKTPLVLDRELPGFIANRLQEALWREALHMVAAGEATVGQLDASIAHGPGLRWALLGPCLTFHLAGGPGGMAHMLDQFGPALLDPLTRLDPPELTDELRDRMVAGSEAAAGGRSVAELEEERDAFLVDLLLLLERHAQRWGRRPAPPHRG
jgi:carnitine 3-dehydrogenase